MSIIQIPLVPAPICLTQNSLKIMMSMDNEKAETNVKRELCSVVSLRCFFLSWFLTYWAFKITFEMFSLERLLPVCFSEI